MQLQLADSSVQHPEQIIEDVQVRVWDCFVPVDIVVLDMDNQKETTLILGRPFLNTMHILMSGTEKSDSISMVKRRNLISDPRRSNA